MAKRGHTEEEILRVLREAEAGETVVEVVPQAWNQPAEFLSLEEEVRWSGTERAAGVASVTRGERQGQAAGGGSEP